MITKGFSDEIQKIPGVEFIRCECQVGRAELEVGFSPKTINKADLAEKARELSKLLPDGNIFIQAEELKSKQRAAHIQSLEISVTGDQSEKCQKIAKESLELINADSMTFQSYLNFKESPEEFVFLPDIQLLAKNSLETQATAEFLHWTLCEPVIDKWTSGGFEYDIKLTSIQSLKDSSIKEFKNLHVPTQSGGVKISSLGKIVRQKSKGKIYRLNGQRCAFFTVQRTERSSTKAVKNVQEILRSINLPKGYHLSFSKEINQLKKHYKIGRAHV